MHIHYSQVMQQQILGEVLILNSCNILRGFISQVNIGNTKCLITVVLYIYRYYHKKAAYF